MAEKPETSAKPAVENKELADGELENVAGGLAVDAVSAPQDTTESAQGSTQGTILKTKHDTVKNSISNVR